jgi:hypothetical protein
LDWTPGGFEEVGSGPWAESCDRPFSREIPYRLCASCEDEHRDFLEKKKGGDRKEFYWHNREWMATWEAWIDQQRAVRKYENTNSNSYYMSSGGIWGDSSPFQPDY